MWCAVIQTYNVFKPVMQAVTLDGQPQDSTVMATWPDMATARTALGEIAPGGHTKIYLINLDETEFY